MDISVVMPAFNAADVIGLQLEALSRQDYVGEWEIIIADNGSTDALRQVVESLLLELPSLPPCRVVDASRLAGSGYARTIGIMYASAELLAFCDADDVVSPKWLTAIVAGLREYDTVTGPVANATPTQLAKHPPHWLFEHLSFENGVSKWAREGVNLLGGNSGYRRRALSGFAPDFLGAQDDAVSLRCATAGMTKGWVEEARILYRRRDRPSAVFAQGFRSGVGNYQAWREFPDIVPSATPLVRTVGWLAVHLPSTVRRNSRVKWAEVAGRLCGLRFEQLLPGLYLGCVRARRSRSRRRSG